MANGNVIPPQPIGPLAIPTALPWAIAGDTLQATTVQEATGWQPYPAPPPDYRTVNGQAASQFLLNARGALNAALVAEYPARSSVLVPSTGSVRRVTVNGVQADWTDTGDAASTQAQGFADQINADGNFADQCYAMAMSDRLVIWSRQPGTQGGLFLVAFSIVSGGGSWSGTTTQTPPIMRTPDEVLDLDLVIGSPQADDDGDSAHDARIVFEKSKDGAFRAGSASGTQWDTRGVGSVALGRNGSATDTDAVAIGSGSQALGQNTLAMMGGTTGTDNESMAIGAGSVATGVSAVAIGSNAVTADNGVAIGSSAGAVALAVALGYGASAQDTDAVAIGSSASATDTAAVAIGSSAAATGPSAVAIGPGASASDAGVALSGTAGPGSVAIGNGNATGRGAVAIGSKTQTTQDSAMATGGDATSGGSYRVVATATGSRAHGQSLRDGVDYTITASGDGARAFGVVDSGASAPTYDSIVASGDHAYAHGPRCQASKAFARATGFAARARTAGERRHQPFSSNATHAIGDVVFAASTSGLTPATATVEGGDTTFNLGLTQGLPPDAGNNGTVLQVTAVANDGATGGAGYWQQSFLIENTGSPAAVAIGSPVTAGSITLGGVALSFSGTYSELVSLSCTGASGKTLTWTIRIDYTQTYGQRLR